MKESQASLLLSLPEKLARRKLLEYMDLSLDFGYDEGLRSQIHNDLLYDCYIYAVDKGFSWRDVCIAVHLTETLLSALIGKSMVDATTIYKEAALMSGMDNRNLAVFTDYFFSTFMQHYKLYQYVYSFERDLARHVTHVSVEAPVPPEELRNAKTPSLHEYDQQIKEIQKNRAEVKELQPLSSVEVQLDEDLTTCAQTEALQKMISQVLQNVGTAVIQDISETISSTYNELEVKLEETALARPKQLGPPPRYQIQPALPMSKATLSVKAPAPTKGSARSDRRKSPKVK